MASRRAASSWRSASARSVLPSDRSLPRSITTHPPARPNGRLSMINRRDLGLDKPLDEATRTVAVYLTAMGHGRQRFQRQMPAASWIGVSWTAGWRPAVLAPLAQYARRIGMTTETGVRPEESGRQRCERARKPPAAGLKSGPGNEGLGVDAKKSLGIRWNLRFLRTFRLPLRLYLTSDEYFDRADYTAPPKDRSRPATSSGFPGWLRFSPR